RTKPRLASGVLTTTNSTVCEGGDANSGSTPTGGNSTGSSQQQHVKVGDQVKVGDTFVVTVNSVKTSKGDHTPSPHTLLKIGRKGASQPMLYPIVRAIFIPAGGRCPGITAVA